MVVRFVHPDFPEKYIVGLNTLRIPAEVGESKLDKIDGVCVGSWDPFGNYVKKSQRKKNVWKIIEGKLVK